MTNTTGEQGWVTHRSADGSQAARHTAAEECPWCPEPPSATEVAAHVAALLRSISNSPLQPGLDPLTWRAAMLAAANIVEEDAAMREGDPVEKVRGRRVTAEDQCHPRCVLGPNSDHSGSREYRCIDRDGNSLPFLGEARL